MYLKALKRLRHTTRFHLTVWYAGLYLLYTLVLGGLTYVLLASSLQQRDHQHIAMELHEMVKLYAHSGVAGVQHGVDSYGQPSYYFVRLTGADRATLVLALPAYWVPSDCCAPLAYRCRCFYEHGAVSQMRSQGELNIALPPYTQIA